MAIRAAAIDAAQAQEAGRLQAALAEAWASSPEGLSKAAEKAIKAEFGVAITRDGAVQVRSRDGLVSLFNSGAITQRQAKAGMAYRLCFERIIVLRSCLGNAGMGGGAPYVSSNPFDGRDPKALQMAYLNARIRSIERAVGDVVVDGRELLALQAIAGQRRTVREVAGQGGHAKAAFREALVRALDAVADYLRITAH